MKHTLTLSVFVSLLITANAQDHSQNHTHGDHEHHHQHVDNAPIGLMGTHSHDPGEWMFSYRYMFMNMDGLRAGDSSFSPAETFAANYTVAPIDMPMQMHMIGAMYAPIERLTLSAMAHYRSSEMKHEIFPNAAPLLRLNDGNNTFTTESSGFGDTTIGGLYAFRNTHRDLLQAGLHLSLPTGSTTEEDIIPGPGGRIKRRLPAAMQLGSGSLAVIPSLTAVRNEDDYSYGGQLRGIFQTEDNDEGYQRGDRYEATAWGAYHLSDTLGISAGLTFASEDELSGSQEKVATNPPFAPSRRTVTTAFGENYGGERLDAILGLNYNAPCDSAWDNNRLGLDLRLPIHQDLNGIQLETDWQLTLGWTMSF